MENSTLYSASLDIVMARDLSYLIDFYLYYPN